MTPAKAELDLLASPHRREGAREHVRANDNEEELLHN
jgi:hypothetical protein